MERKTYRSNEDFVARFDVDLAAGVEDGSAGLGLAVGSKGTVDTDGLQAVAAQLLLRVGVILLGQLVDLGEVLLAFRRQEVVDDASELFSQY